MPVFVQDPEDPEMAQVVVLLGSLGPTEVANPLEKQNNRRVIILVGYMNLCLDSNSDETLFEKMTCSF